MLTTFVSIIPFFVIFLSSFPLVQCAPRNVTFDAAMLSSSQGWIPYHRDLCTPERCQGIDLSAGSAGNVSSDTLSIPDEALSPISFSFHGTAIYLSFVQVFGKLEYTVEFDGIEETVVTETGTPNGTQNIYSRVAPLETHQVRLQSFNRNMGLDFIVYTDDDGAVLATTTTTSGLPMEATQILGGSPATDALPSDSVSAISLGSSPSFTAVGATSPTPIETHVHVHVTQSQFPPGATAGIAIAGSLSVLMFSFFLYKFLRNRCRQVRQNRRAHHVNDFSSIVRTSLQDASLESGLAFPTSVASEKTLQRQEEQRRHQREQSVRSEIDTLRSQIRVLRHLKTELLPQPSSPTSAGAREFDLYWARMDPSSPGSSTAPEGFSEGNRNLWVPPPSPPPVYTSPLTRFSRRFTFQAPNLNV